MDQKTKKIIRAATPVAMADCPVLLPLYFWNLVKSQVDAPAVNKKLIKAGPIILIIAGLRLTK